MFPIRFKRPALLCMAMLTVVLSGCGLIQKVVDESKSVASAVFYKQIKILHLDFFSRSALNTDAEDTPLSTMVHVWQLKTREDFDKADYDTLFMQEEDAGRGRTGKTHRLGKTGRHGIPECAAG